MRLLKCGMLLFTLFMTWIFFSSLSLADDAGKVQNMVPNPGFENMDNGGWVAPWSSKEPVFSVSTEASHSGKRCLRYQNSDSNNYVLSSVPVNLATGNRYNFSAWVRTENVTGSDSGATICVEWYDKNDKYLGGVYPSGVKGSNSEWQKISGITDPIPANATSASISCYLRKGMIGTAWWDDVELQEYIPPLVDGITTNLYRNSAAGGQVQAKAGLNLTANGLTPSGVKAQLEILDAQQKVVLTAPALETNEGEAAFSFDAGPLAPATYELRCVVQSSDGKSSGQASCQFTRTATTISRKVWIDQHRRLIVDGQPFFPLGTYWSTITKDQLGIYSESVFNCLMAYNSPSLQQLDMAQSYGFKVIYSLKDYYAGMQYCPAQIKSPSDELTAIEQKVREVGDHPAIIAWYINDELPLSMLDRLTAHQGWLEKIDPQHPTWAVLDKVYDLSSYLQTFDVVGTDPYPIPGQAANMALQYARLTSSGTLGLRGVWMVPQIMNWAASRSGPGLRAPTLDEMRSMAWQCIAAGANGLIFYSWFDLNNKSVEPFQQRWPDICQMAEEIKSFFPVLLSVDAAPQPDNVDAPENLAWRVYGKSGDIYLLAVNSDITSAEAQFHFPMEFSKCSTELGTNTVSCSGSNVSMKFAALEPKIIRLTPGALKPPSNLRLVTDH